MQEPSHKHTHTYIHSKLWVPSWRQNSKHYHMPRIQQWGRRKCVRVCMCVKNHIPQRLFIARQWVCLCMYAVLSESEKWELTVLLSILEGSDQLLKWLGNTWQKFEGLFACKKVNKERQPGSRSAVKPSYLLTPHDTFWLQCSIVLWENYVRKYVANLTMCFPETVIAPQFLVSISFFCGCCVSINVYVCVFQWFPLLFECQRSPMHFQEKPFIQ